jgi:hypothetical protein
LKEFASSLPSSLLAGRKALGTSTDDFEKFVCCPTCSCIYRIEDCQERLPNGKIVSKKCSFIQFPQHPQKQHRKPCGTTLLKTVRTSSGSTSLYPRVLFCHKGFIESLQQMIKRPNFFC